MIIRIGSFCYWLVIIITVCSPIVLISDAYAQRPEESLDWSIQTSKKMFYPGEPVLLTLNISNAGKQKERIDFGTHDLEAFSMEIRDGSNKVVAKGDKIRRHGFAAFRPTIIPAGKTGQKSIVLNQWCSTLLPLGQYHVICRVEYRLRSEATKIPGTEPALFKAGHLHSIKLKLDIEVIKSDDSQFKKTLEDLAKRAFKTDVRGKKERACRRIAREMITFAESDLAVPYQLHVLRVAPSTWLKWDVINSLVRSGTLEAAEGLVQIIEDCPECGIEDVKHQIIDAVYRLRETGNPDIINATGEFVAKYKRPIPAGPPAD